MSRIHPSFRAALTAWFVGRVLMWSVAHAAGAATFAPAGIETFARGAPGWALLVHGVDALSGLFGLATPVCLAVLGELALLVSSVAVYRFVRRDSLPQTAERATWLWALCPVMTWTLPVSPWNFAAAAAAVAMASSGAGRHLAATAALSVAMAFRPEALLLWPGLAMLGWRAYQAPKIDAWRPWALTLGPLVAFSGLIAASIAMAGRLGVSLRTLHADAAWRGWLTGQGFDLAWGDGFFVAALAVGVLAAARTFRQTPRAWPLIALPCLAWPLLHEPTTAAAGIVLLAVPAFAQLARLADDPATERPLLVASVGGLLLLMVV